MAWTEIASDDFADVGSGVGIWGRALSGSSGYKWGPRSPEVAAEEPLGDGSGNIYGADDNAKNGFALLCESDGVTPVAFNAVKIDLTRANNSEIVLLNAWQQPELAATRYPVYRLQQHANDGGQLLYYNGYSTLTLNDDPDKIFAGEVHTLEVTPGHVRHLKDGVEEADHTDVELIGPFYVGIQLQDTLSLVSEVVFYEDQDYEFESTDGYAILYRDGFQEAGAGESPSGDSFLAGAAEWGSLGGTHEDLVGDGYSNVEGDTTYGKLIVMEAGGASVLTLNEGGISALAAEEGAIRGLGAWVNDHDRQDGYYVSIYPDNHANGVRLFRYDEGSGTLLDQATNYRWKDGDRFTLVVGNGFQKVYKNEELVVSAVDETYSSGFGFTLEAQPTATWAFVWILGPSGQISSVATDDAEFEENAEGAVRTPDLDETVADDFSGGTEDVKIVDHVISSGGFYWRETEESQNGPLYGAGGELKSEGDSTYYTKIGHPYVQAGRFFNVEGGIRVSITRKNAVGTVALRLHRADEVSGADEGLRFASTPTGWTLEQLSDSELASGIETFGADDVLTLEYDPDQTVRCYGGGVLLAKRACDAETRLVVILETQGGSTIELDDFLVELAEIEPQGIEQVEFGEVATEVFEGLRSPSPETVEFGELAGVIHEVSGEDTLELGEDARRAFSVEAEDTLELDEDAQFQTGAKEGVEFDETASATVVIQVYGEDSLEFTEGAAYLPTLEGCETSFEPDPAILEDPKSNPYVYLLGPWATLTYSIRLPRPEFGDVRRNNLQVIVHRTRGGQRRVYKRTPTYRTLQMRFSALRRKKLLELEYFLEHTAGEDVRLVDHEGRTWRGNILTTPADLESAAPDDGRVTLEFEGSTL